MKRLLFTFLALCLAVAGSAQSGQMTSKLPTIDITKEYPKKKLVLQDIATAEYIPLETSDKVLLDGVATLHCSFTEHYITTYNANEGQIFVFDRKGKICHTFNHKGGSGEEYNYPLQLRLDEKAKELFLLDISNKIQVYSIEGKYKRSLSIPKDVRIEIMYNCDEQHLLGYDSYMLDRKDKQSSLFTDFEKERSCFPPSGNYPQTCGKTHLYYSRGTDGYRFNVSLSVSK